MTPVRLSRSPSPWNLFLSLALASTLLGCASSGPAASEDNTPDAGEPSADGGNPSSDGGTSPPDGGTRPLPPFTWGQGTLTGTLVGDVWTPGRDSAGLVNEASWATVPKGRWIEVAGTPLTSLDAEVKAALPGFRDLGSQGIAGVINAYSGVALDAPRARWWAFGGGHADSTNNGLYRFDMAQMRWSIEQLPDNSTHWAGVPWGNTYSAYPPAAEYAKAHPTSDVYSDEFFDPARPAASTGNPVARHTYNGLVYNPDLDEVAFGVRRMWRYSLKTHTWKRHNPFNTPGATYTGATGYGGAAGWTYWDEKAGRYLFGPTENYNASRWWSFGTTDASWKWEVVTPPAWSFAQMARVGRTLVSFPAPGHEEAHVHFPRLITYDLDTTRWGELRLRNDLVRARCYAAPFEGQVFAYVPPLERYIAAFRYDRDGDGTFEYRTWMVDPVALTLTEAPEYEVGAFGGWHELVKNRFFYLATHDALVYVRKGEENLRVFRLP
ncbi:hypothetical protein MYSTI_05815 [Myxococcus stipitatus DSM 14675]|uniref:Lipoprotein n=1 Tax=Myxococcus stipitatus (strain DSM 14675 / JCM 12634 / Mx s8) TaxID=1278073 RepID=L7UDV0_MYXSD|nr:hypothetical protein [Myxococcus stipitatus]AGC47091.1 hypothetical protein MYSTI_05815 [Myxococcus stipitatus DSM 14675]